MQTSLAQMIALTCYGNALLRGIPAQSFALTHSTCRFCALVRFVAGGNGGSAPVEVAPAPAVWLEHLAQRGAVALGLEPRAQNRAGISDRNAAAFAGGGRNWRIVVHGRDGQSEFWGSRWEIGDRQAADRRIWRVTFALFERAATVPFPPPGLDRIAAALEAALGEIRAFAQRENCSNFLRCFDDALSALHDPAAEIGYHKDLAPPGILVPRARSLLQAAQAAWVFGGMGSWNDMSFAGATQKEYERVSDRLFDLLNDAAQAAASSSAAAPAV